MYLSRRLVFSSISNMYRLKSSFKFDHNLDLYEGLENIRLVSKFIEACVPSGLQTTFWLSSGKVVNLQFCLDIDVLTSALSYYKISQSSSINYLQKIRSDIHNYRCIFNKCTSWKLPNKSKALRMSWLISAVHFLSKSLLLSSINLLASLLKILRFFEWPSKSTSIQSIKLLRRWLFLILLT